MLVNGLGFCEHFQCHLQQIIQKMPFFSRYALSNVFGCFWLTTEIVIN
jgi:hypothetical protein